MELFIFGAILVFGGGIAIILKRGFNEKKNININRFAL